MENKWGRAPFGQLLAEPVRNGIYKPKEFHGRGTKIVNMGELFAHPRLRSVPMKRVELSESESDRFDVRKGDLLFARRSLVAEGAGKCSIVLDVNEPTTFESSIIRARPDTSKADPLFLFYFFNSTPGLHALDSIRRQVAVAGITGTDLVQLEVPLPDPEEQSAIAHILGMLDDKIELNQRMSETLEAMAQAIFKSWFVEFDPVRTKGEGRAPGLPKHIEDLFSDRFEDSELGEIPAGWSVGTIGEATSLIIDYRGKTPKKLGREWSLSGIPAVSAKNIKKGRLIQKQSMNFVDPDLYDVWMKDRLMVDDILMTSEAPLGELLYLARETEFCLSQRVFALRANRRNCTSSFLYFWLASDNAQKRLQSRATGTTVLGIRQSELRKVEVLLPPLPIQEASHLFFEPSLKTIAANETQNETLTALRDTLLLKLISGELHVSYPERFIKRHV